MDTSHKPWFWRGMAIKAWAAANGLTDRELRLQMLVIAAAYDAMARRAQALGKLPPISVRSASLSDPANTSKAA